MKKDNQKVQNLNKKVEMNPKDSMKVKKPKDIRGTLIRLIGDINDQKSKLIFVFAIVLLVQVVVQISTILYGQSIKVIQVNATSSIVPKDLLVFATLTLISYIFAAILEWLQQFMLIGISQTTVFNIRTNLFKKLQKLSLSFFDSHDKGDLMSRLTNDVETINNTLSNSLINIVSSISSLVFTIIMMFIYSWQLALVAMITMPFVLLMTAKFSKISKKYYKQQQKNLGALNAKIEETITAQKVVKVFACEDKEAELFEEKNVLFKNAAIKANIVGGVMGPTMNMLNNITFLMIAFVGSIMVINNTIEIWLISQFFIYARIFGRPLSQLAQMMPQIQSAVAGAERVYKIMDEHEEIVDSKNAITVGKFDGKVEFKKVDFGYLKDKLVLNEINISVNPGETIALVGPTGAGKTTIINLLTRFYDVNRGEILIDGINIKDMSKYSLRSQLGIVLQDVYLFAESAMENIKYGDLDATDEMVYKVAQQSNAHQFIHRLPDGYDTILSEEGSNLSQGQRQLLSISRAMLADPSILILDEATSSVDTRTEMHIQEAMLELMKNRTSFVIAHRLSTIKNADVILVIDDGRIIEHGSHDELIEEQGFYYNMYNSQFNCI